MKKNFFRIAAIALAAMLVITGCATDNGSTVSKKTVRIIGTYGELNTTTRALSRAGESEPKMGITSVDKVVVNGTNITEDLKPVNPNNVKPGQNNVEFEAQVEVPSTVNFAAAAKPGYVFDEWKVSKDAEKALRKEIKKWLDKGDREESETLVDLPANYIPFLIAEYDNGYYVSLDDKTAPAADAPANNGTKNLPFTVTEFKTAMAEYNEDELTLVITGTNTDNFQALIDTLTAKREGKEAIEEIKIKANGVTLKTLPKFTGLEEISLAGFTFTDAITVTDLNEISFENCKFTALTVSNVQELEIEGGEANNITVSGDVEEAEFENIKITEGGKIDLTGMTSGEVEIEGIAPEFVDYDKTNKKLEVEFDD